MKTGTHSEESEPNGRGTHSLTMCKGWLKGPASLEEKKLREHQGHVKLHVEEELDLFYGCQGGRYWTFGKKSQETVEA